MRFSAANVISKFEPSTYVNISPRYFGIFDKYRRDFHTKYLSLRHDNYQKLIYSRNCSGCFGEIAEIQSLPLQREISVT